MGGSRCSTASRMKGFFIQMVEGLHVINKKGPSTEEGILGAGRCFQIQRKTPLSALGFSKVPSIC